MSDAFEPIGLHWLSVTIAAAAVIGVTSVLFAFMLGAARIWFALARDGLLPAWFAQGQPALRHAGTARRSSWACSPRWSPACCRSAKWPSWSTSARSARSSSSALRSCCCACAGRTCSATFARRGVVHRAAGHRVFRGADLRPAVDHLRALHALDGGRLRDLFRVWHPAQQAGAGAGSAAPASACAGADMRSRPPRLAWRMA